MKTGPQKKSSQQTVPHDRIKILEAELVQKEKELRELRKQLVSNHQPLQNSHEELLTSNEERQSSNEVREYNKKLDLILKASQTGVWEWDIQKNKVIWDARTEQIYGFAENEFDGSVETYLQRIHPEDASQVQSTFQKALQQGTSYCVEHRIVWPDLSIHHVIGHGTIVRNEQGTPVKILGTCQDFTDHHHKDEKIKRFGKLLEESYNEIYTFDAETLKFIDVNLGGRNNLGYSMEELSEMTPLDLKPAYSPEDFHSLIQPLRDGSGEKITFETYHLRKNGSTYNVLVNLQLSTYEGRQVFVANIQDITALVQVQQHLHLSEERLALAINGASVGLWDWPDLKSPETWWSPKFYELLGMQDGEIEASNDNFKKLVHPEDHVPTPEEVGRQKDKHIDVDLRLFHKTEGYIWFRIRAQIFKDKQGKPVRMAGAITDINKKKRAEFQLNHTNLKLKQANKYLDNFVFTVAHDLRSPVANLKSLVELFKRQANDHDPIVHRIDLSVERLEQTLRGLIQVLDVQKIVYKVSNQIDIQTVVDKLKKEMEDKIHQYHVNLHTDFVVRKINYIEPYLESIIRNLLSNAIKYSKEEAPPQISLRTKKAMEFILLEVEDNGTGINLPRYREKIFKPFEKLAKKSSGQGVGLHLIKTMVEKNGGRVEVESKLNVGTVFKIYLKSYPKNEA